MEKSVSFLQVPKESQPRSRKNADIANAMKKDTTVKESQSKKAQEKSSSPPKKQKTAVGKEESKSPNKKQSSTKKSKKNKEKKEFETYQDLFPQVEHIKKDQKLRLFESYRDDVATANNLMGGNNASSRYIPTFRYMPSRQLLQRMIIRCTHLQAQLADFNHQS